MKITTQEGHGNPTQHMRKQDMVWNPNSIQLLLLMGNAMNYLADDAGYIMKKI